MLDADVTRFVDEAAALPPAELDAAFERLIDLRGEGGREAADAAVPSASANSALDHRIRAALLPRADELNAHLPGLHSDARAAISTTARAILTRHRLTAGQYAVLVEPFAGRGPLIPPFADSAAAAPEAAPATARPERGEPAATRFVQKAVLPGREGAWLRFGDEVVSGFVVDAADAAWADTPEKVFRLHGLGFAGSPLSPDLPFLDVVRIPVTPFTRLEAATGGTNAQEARLTGGRFIDHPPFSGNGFVVGVPERIVPLWWLDPVRIPAGTELWRVYADAHEELVAVYPHLASGWQTVGEYASDPERVQWPSAVLNVFGHWRGQRVFVDPLRDGRVAVASTSELEGLTRSRRGLWAGVVDAAEVTGISAVRFTCAWRGARFQIVNRYESDGGPQAQLVYTGANAVEAEGLQLVKTDAGVYEATAPWAELTEVEGFEVVPAPGPGVVPPPAQPAAPAPPALTPSSELVAVGRALFAGFAPDAVLTEVDLPDGLGVCLVHAARGGGKIYVAPDHSALFVGSALDFEAGLAAFREGARTPLEKFRSA